MTLKKCLEEAENLRTSLIEELTELIDGLEEKEVNEMMNLLSFKRKDVILESILQVLELKKKDREEQNS